MLHVDRYKNFKENGLYHIYNRGVAKEKIFFARADYLYYVRCLKEALLPKDVLMKLVESSKLTPQNKLKRYSKIARLKNYSKLIELYSYCLMPNHFHLVIKQKNARDISSFMSSVQTRYCKFLNIKYSRVGPIFQGRYQARVIHSANSLLYVTRYVHRNPIDISQLSSYPWSSFKYFVSRRYPGWVSAKKILRIYDKSAYYKDQKTYVSFVKDSL